MNVNNIPNYSNHGNDRKLNENEEYKKNDWVSRLPSKENENYAKHGRGASFLIKIKTIFTSLISRYFVDKERNSDEQFPNWRESRMLVTAKGHGATPVLANNNISSVSLNLKSRTVVHTLFFLERNKVQARRAVIEFED